MTERLYYRDSTLLDFSATVVSVTDVNGRVAVELDRTAFYPTSGGQPHDLGDIDGVPIADVLDAQSGILHVLAGVAPPPGSVVRGRVDARRRIDHTQQHSGQHVLSQALERRGEMRTIAFHLGVDASTIDVDRATIDHDYIGAVEALANQIVFEDRPVLIHLVQPHEVEQFSLRKVTRRTGEIRIVEILDFDRSACGGTHVTRTGQIGLIKILGSERRGTATRIEFLCGWRALGDYTMRLQITRDIAKRLSVADREVRDAVFRLADDLDRVRTELRVSLDHLLEAEADRLIAACRTVSTQPAIRLVRQDFVDRSADDLKRLALRVTARMNVVAMLGSTGERTDLVIAQSRGLGYDVSAIFRLVAPLISARGGGTANLAQGGGPGNQPIDLALDEAARLVENHEALRQIRENVIMMQSRPDKQNKDGRR